MPSDTLHVRIPRSPSAYEILIGDGLLATAGTWAAARLEHRPGRVLVISNPKVFGLYGEQLCGSLTRAGFAVSVHLIGDGERFKSLRTLETALSVLSKNGFRRTDTVVALGGGVVGDLAGFAASVYLRGIPFLQIPTTLLSMIDSSVGGKTGVNTSFGKNLIGSFYQPNGVLIDIATLQTLPRRELTCGFCEAIKQGAIAGRSLLRETDAFLEAYLPGTSPNGPAEQARYSEKLSRLLAAQIKFKAKIVQNDERESVSNDSSRSRKILNFGHTFAHALEKASNYRRIKHGEAVGYGIRFATELSKRLELIGQDEVDLLNDVVRRAGVLPAINSIDPSKLFEAFRHDKKQVGNSLHWVLLSGIGKPVIVPDTNIPRSVIKSTLRTIVQG
jgi:3-dehydroquinate synthase